jgi:hypothetical protein
MLPAVLTRNVNRDVTCNLRANSKPTADLAISMNAMLSAAARMCAATQVLFTSSVEVCELSLCWICGKLTQQQYIGIGKEAADAVADAVAAVSLLVAGSIFLDIRTA